MKPEILSDKGWRAEVPHAAMPLLPPSVELETRAVLKQCITARAALAELKQAAELIPNQGMLINTLPLLEAQASSKIENIVTTADRLFQFQEDATQADPATKEALRYAHALMHGYQELQTRPLTTATAVKVCSQIRGVEVSIRSGPGTVLINDKNGEVVYTPPTGEALLRGLLANWEQFLHAPGDLDPLVRMAVAHYQFEAIHPFTDGNGRTGRILNSLYLIQADLLTLPILYLSRYIIQRKADYYRLLQEVTREQAWEDWLLYLIRGVEETARWTTAKIGAIRRLFTDTAGWVRQAAPKIYSHELVNLIFERPYCRISDLEKAGIAKRQTGSRYLKELSSVGVLEERTFGRDKLFVHPKLLQLLTRDGNAFTPYS